MTQYVKSTSFASKDALPQGNPLKIVKGTEIDTEFNNIAIAVATKADLLSPVFTGTPTAATAALGTSNTQVATTAFVKAQQGAMAITGGTITGTAISGLPSALEIASGGTGLTTVGTDGQVLTSTGTATAWETPASYTDADVKTALNATGSAPIYACRAWARLTDITTLAGNGNFASVSRVSTGIAQFTFTTAMADANYAVVVSGSHNLTSPFGNTGSSFIAIEQTTTGFKVVGRDYTGSTNASAFYEAGYANMGIAVFR